MEQSDFLNYAIIVDGLMKGLYSGIGKDVWEKIKNLFDDKEEKEVIRVYEKEPQNVENKVQFEKMLFGKLSGDIELLALLDKIKEEKVTNIVNSKNTVINSTINTGGGNISIGDIK